ncbi:DUF7010 family protein [Novosphingopyxis sp.]|uniref:DUF7010 family protein n=1 Tax=Novosphingopyxis sp. TaxID=2709690 RepID=UPI003B5CD7CD
MTDNLNELRIDAARRGQWNIGFFAAGAVFWTAATVVGVTVELSQARILWIVGTFFILPIAVVFSRLFGADPFTKGNALGELVGYTHMSVIAMMLPIVVGCAIIFPEALLLVMAIAYCLDFYVMGWAFGSALFGIHAALRVSSVSLLWFAMPEWRMSVLPAWVAALYIATVVTIPILRRR